MGEGRFVGWASSLSRFFSYYASAEERTQGFFNAMNGNELDVAFGTLKSLEIGIGEDEA